MNRPSSRIRQTLHGTQIAQAGQPPLAATVCDTSPNRAADYAYNAAADGGVKRVTVPAQHGARTATSTPAVESSTADAAHLLIDALPTMAWTATPAGSI